MLVDIDLGRLGRIEISTIIAHLEVNILFVSRNLYIDVARAAYRISILHGIDHSLFDGQMNTRAVEIDEVHILTDVLDEVGQYRHLAHIVVEQHTTIVELAVDVTTILDS